MNKSLISILITATLGLSQSYAMTALNDEELSEVEGQVFDEPRVPAGDKYNRCTRENI
jgi:hypothetical protein